MTNKVVEKIINLTDGLILDEGEEQVDTLPIFDNDRIIETELRDWLLPKLMNGQVRVGEKKYSENEVELGMVAESEENYKSI